MGACWNRHSYTLQCDVGHDIFVCMLPIILGSDRDCDRLRVIENISRHNKFNSTSPLWKRGQQPRSTSSSDTHGKSCRELGNAVRYDSNCSQRPSCRLRTRLHSCYDIFCSDPIFCNSNIIFYRFRKVSSPMIHIANLDIKSAICIYRHDAEGIVLFDMYRFERRKKYPAVRCISK